MRNAARELKFLLLLAAAQTVGLTGCASNTLWVTRGPHPEQQTRPVRVGYPPPPARIEYIPLQRRPECRYQDGYYTSQGGAWTWRPGKWVVEAKECYFAAPVTKYEETPQGQLLMHRAPGYFQKKEPHRACKPPPSCDSETESLSAER